MLDDGLSTLDGLLLPGQHGAVSVQRREVLAVRIEGLHGIARLSVLAGCELCCGQPLLEAACLVVEVDDWIEQYRMRRRAFSTASRVQCCSLLWIRLTLLGCIKAKKRQKAC